MVPNSPDTLARRWVPGDGAVEIRALGSGLVNSSYRVVRAGKAYLLRVAAADSLELGVDREWEMRVLAVAGAADLAPAVVRCEPAQGILVSDWLEGRTWTAAEACVPANRWAMAGLLRQVHSLTIPEPARIVPAAAWIDRYRSALARAPRGVPASAAEFAGVAALRLETLAGFGLVTPVLCHSDLHRLNVSVGRRVRLLDWEYAHVADGFWDLAGWIGGNDWTLAEAEQFLGHYLERPATAPEQQRLRVLVWLYDYVCLLWGALYLSQRPGEATAELSERSSVIAARLRSGFGGRAG